MNYYDTLIEAADDCPATKAQVPQARGGKKTKAGVMVSPTSRWETTACMTGVRLPERAAVVAPGTTSGERMRKARHTAGQRVLDATGNLKATQKLLGHASIQTSGDVYADWDIDTLADTMRAVLEGE